MATQKNSADHFLEFRSVSKSFGTLKANQDISFSVRAGSIHALIGENGAGKSTLMKILFGLYSADAGSILLDGQPTAFTNSIEAKAAGLGMVHQHFMLAGPISALDHIILDEESPRRGLARWLAPLPRKAILKNVEKVAEKFNMPVPWNEAVENLPVGLQQRLEILKLLYNQAEILILDEPTAVLTPQEIDGFFSQLRQLKAAGKTILIITHKLKEVLSLADDFSVLRQGQLIHSGKVEGQTLSSLGELMIGRKPRALPKATTTSTHQPPALKIEGLSYQESDRTWLHSISLHVQPGEIVGLAGVEANGQSQLLNLLFRPRDMDGTKAGRIQILQNDSLNLSNTEIRSLGVNYFPEDRLRQAVLLNGNARENFLLGQQWRKKFSRWGWLKWSSIENEAAQMMQKNDVRPLDVHLPMSRFSGGNQQKFVVGRELSQSPKLLIAAQPTRGVDIGAIESIHGEILRHKESGTAVFLVSSELEEIMKLSDRIYVLFQGRIVAEMSANQYDEKRIGAFMGGAEQ